MNEPPSASIGYGYESDPSNPSERHRISAMVFEHIGEAVAVTNRSGRIMLANPAFARYIRQPVHHLIGQQLDHFLASHDPELRPIALPDWRQADFHEWSGVVWLHNGEATPVPAHMTLSDIPVFADRSHPLIACFSDLSSQYRQQRQLWELAHRDRTTGLPNFRSFEEKIQRVLLTAGERFGHILLIHAGGIAEIFGAHGHVVGEQVLRILATRLKNLCPQSEDVAYLDSGVFGVLLAGRAHAETQDLARTSLGAFMESVQTDKQHFHLKPHVGVCDYPESGANAADLIRHARLALHEAELAVTPNVRVFSLEQDASVRERLMMESHLSNAVKNGELHLHFQPQISLKERRCIGAEALLRWRNPSLGDIAPTRFIPVAEASGAMLSIGSWVLDEACRQQHAWQQAGHVPVPLAVNVSAPQVLEDDLADVVEKTLIRHDLDPHWLEIEITEGLLLTDSRRAMETLRKLASLGVRLALDDFGTGYASFSYLQRFQFHRLKIDRSLVQQVAERERDAAIVNAIAGMGRALGMEILAEGVEQESQARILSQNGCDAAQGFLYSRPLPAQSAGEWISHHANR